MRRFLAFITIAMLALAANAQQSPTNTDAVRSKLTMRGYKAFYDVNYLFTIYPSDTDTGNSLGFSTSHGFQFNNYLYFGGGIGFNSFFCDGTTRLVGSYDSLVLGMRLALKNNHSLTAGVEYSVQSDISDNGYYQTNIGFRLGYEF